MTVTPPPCCGAAIHRGEFAEHVAIADLETRRFALVLEILRRVADRGELEDLVAGADAWSGPLMTACGPIQVPAPMLHAGADDRVRTHGHVGGELRLGRDDGAGVDSAHDRVTPILPGWPLARRHHHLGAAHLRVAHEGHGRELPDAAHGALELRGEDELIARLDRLAEARLVDADEIETRGFVGHDVRGDEGEHAGGLRQRLDDHDARHDGTMREMSRERTAR